ncbi:MAG: MFS transporter [Candidatus Marinimicrobia bacterium]|nr:MFS transporter [Candidatus Neomarinimicrobiota bacterium]
MGKLVESKDTRRWILLATILGSSLTFIDATVVNIALPALQENLDANVTDVQWVIEGYALMLAALILVSGSLGDSYGRKRIFIMGVILFTGTSLWCGLAGSIQELIIARIFQGIGGALIIPSSLAILSSSFDDNERGKAIGTWSSFTAITAALGPLLGGWLIENYSWRWIFFINLPVAVIVLYSTTKISENRSEDRSKKLDWVGATLVTLGLGAIVYGLVESAQLGLGSSEVITLELIGVLLIGIFLIVESKIENPMMPLKLFKSRMFSGSNVLTFFLYAALSGAFFFFPFNLIQLQGYTATEAGAAFLPFVILIFLLSRWAGGLVDKYGAKFPLIIGPLIVSAGYLLYAVPGIGGSYWETFFPAIVTVGIGMGISVAPLTTSVMSSVSQDHSGLASGINNAVARTAGLLAIAVMGIIVVYDFNLNLDIELDRIEMSTELKEYINSERINLAGIQIPEGVDIETEGKIRKAINISFLSAFRMVMIISALLALASSFTALLSISGKKKSISE